MADIRKLLRLSLASALLAAPLCAQQPVAPLADPANLTGEHVVPQSPADTLPINHGAPALQQLLQKLRTRASMLLVVAHPDDEDGGFLTYESRGQGARVGMLTLNRGEGGQNLMTADFDDALGLLRTQELLAADRYMGVDQFFGSVADFGFSKTKEETLEKWTHERVLYDAVRVLRLYRPLIIASVFVGGPTDGHGQHQVAGEIAQEAFVAAADPKVFPEMGLPPWAPLKVYARTPFARVTNGTMHDSATGKDMPVVFHNYVTNVDLNHAPAATVQIHEGEVSTQLGMDGDSYGAFARRGLALQKSQIGNFAGGGGRGGGDAGYTLMAIRIGCPMITGGAAGGYRGVTPFCPPSTAAEQSPFDGIDTSLPAIATLAPAAPATLRTTLEAIDKQIEEAQGLFDPTNIERTAPPLREALKSLDTLIATEEKAGLPATQTFNLLHELRIKRVQLNNALVLAHGLTLTAASDTPGRFGIEAAHATLKAAGMDPLFVVQANALSEGSLSSRDAISPRAGKPLPITVETNLHLLSARTPTRPFFSRPNLEQPFYDISDPALRNAPATPAPFISSAIVNDSGVLLEVRAIVPDPTPLPTNFVVQPAVVVPNLSISLAPTSGIITPAGKPLILAAVVTSQATLPKATATVTGPAGWEGALDAHLEALNPGRRETLPLAITPKNYYPGQTYKLTGSASDSAQTYHEGFRPVGYPGLTYTNMYTPATYNAVAIDVTTAPKLKVAYLQGTGDDVPAFLPNLGVTPTILTVKDLTAANLAQYDAVILGVRTYAAHPELAGTGSKPLLDYAAAGGIVITQYQNGRYGAAEAPYPITTALSSGDHSHDVVVESQPLTILKPDAPLLSWPNKIVPADFKNWVAEWGHGFAGTWAPQYQALLEVHDPDQDPQEGSLLVAPVGKGAYIYCGLALYRQLPEGVPGAYRLYANLLSYAKNPNR